MLVLVEIIREISTKGPISFIGDLKNKATHPIELFQSLSISMEVGLKMAPLDAQWSFIENYIFKCIYQRQRISSLSSTIADTNELLRRSCNILVICGAGISVGAGIPDFRSPDIGLYSTLKNSHPQLPQPESLFDIEYFRKDPEPFYNFMRENLLNKKVKKMTQCHSFIKEIENRGKLLRLYTQNIDSLENEIDRVVYCHGSPNSFSCIDCYSEMCDDFHLLITIDLVPKCPYCSGLIKPNISFFNEGLKGDYDQKIKEDIEKADLLIVIGTSMEVYPVSSIPDILAPGIPQILINKIPLLDHNYDIVLIGDCQEIVTSLIV